MKITNASTLALAGIFAVGAWTAAGAAPKNPLPKCHMEKSCKTITVQCPPHYNPYNHNCRGKTSWSYQQCTNKKVCTDL